MVTTASDKVINVCEMLVCDQKKETMRHCFKFFKDVMEIDKIETIVIDKDFTEWSVLEEVLPHVKVSRASIMLFDSVMLSDSNTNL